MYKPIIYKAHKVTQSCEFAVRYPDVWKST